MKWKEKVGSGGDRLKEDRSEGRREGNEGDKEREGGAYRGRGIS